MWQSIFIECSLCSDMGHAIALVGRGWFQEKFSVGNNVGKSRPGR
jgi:hypothetical protein